MKDGDPRIVDGSLLRKDQTVFDVVYNRETELLKDAALAGCRRLDGVMMLVYQGAEAFRIWTGRKAPAKVMEQAVREALAGRGR
jgi:shikimate dehydrogenase